MIALTFRSAILCLLISTVTPGAFLGPVAQIDLQPAQASADMPSVAISSDGRFMAASEGLFDLTIWDAKTRRRLRGFKYSEGLIEAIAFAPKPKKH